MNSFNAIGRVGGDPVVTETRDGKAVCSFSVAVDSGYGERKVTTWIKVALFDKRASVADYIQKGDRIGIHGEIANREYKDKSGVMQKSLELQNADVTLIMPKRDVEAKPTEPKTVESNYAPFDDNVPF